MRYPRVGSGEDRFGERRGLGVSTLQFKLTASETGDALFVIENSFTRKGGPPRHLHQEQDEFFYVVQGSFAFEIGDQRFRLEPGDSGARSPTRAPCLACTSETGGRILIAFAPAGRMEAFFREVTRADADAAAGSRLVAGARHGTARPPLQV